MQKFKIFEIKDIRKYLTNKMEIINKYVKPAFKKYIVPATIGLFALSSIACANANVNAVDTLHNTLPYDSLKSKITAIYDGTNDTQKKELEDNVFVSLKNLRTKFAGYISDAYVNNKENEAISKDYNNFRKHVSKYDNYCKKFRRANDISNKLNLIDKELKLYKLFDKNINNWSFKYTLHSPPEAEKFGRKLGYDITVEPYWNALEFLITVGAILLGAVYLERRRKKRKERSVHRNHCI